MKIEKQKELADKLNKWFLSHANRKTNFWNQNPVAKILKNNLEKWGHFKKRPKDWLDF